MPRWLPRSDHLGTSLYDKLEHAVIPVYERDRLKLIEVMRHAIAPSGAFFNMQRMLQQYIARADFD
jgi:glycogen phosphorylase